MIVFEQSPVLLDWAAKVLKVNFFPAQCAWLTAVSGDEIQAVVIYHQISPFNCEMSVASNGKKRWFSRQSANVWFGYPFRQMNMYRVTAVAEQDNFQSVNMLRKLGFVEEATLKNWFGNKDGIVFRMLKEECKWLT